MALRDADCRAARPAEKPYRLADGSGLSLLVSAAGTKTWVHRYRRDGKSREDVLGRYPAMTLAAARSQRDKARASTAAGTGTTFRNVTEEWFEKKKRPTLEPRTATRQWTRVADLFAEIGDMDIAEIGPADVLRALRTIEGRGAVYTARRVRGMAEAVFGYARIPYDLTAANPASPELLRNLRPVPPTRNQPALPFADLPEFFRRLRHDRCGQTPDDTRTRLAVELILHTVLRSDELRHGRWDQIRGDEWHLPAEAMKRVNGVSRDHIVPLTRRAQEILAELKPFARSSAMILPGLRPGRPMSEATMSNWMKARGYQDVATIHGFRTTFSTHAHESGRWESRWIEVQLAHVDRDKVRGVYNKAVYLEHRRQMMDWWGEELATQEALFELL